MIRNFHIFAIPFFAIFILLSPTGAAAAQDQPQEPGWAASQKLFEKNCSTCHGAVSSDGRAPNRETLMKLPPETIFAALTTGVMRMQAKDLTEAQKRLIAQHLSGLPFGTAGAGDAKTMSNRCSTNPPLADPAAGPAWNGWGGDEVNTRFQSAQAAGLTAAQVPHLKLKWAFGFPYGAEIYSQPTIVSGRVFIGGDTGFVYSLDAATGCVYWSFLAQAGVRTAPSVGPLKEKGAPRYAVYFGDMRANVYALDATTGELLWKQHVEDHPLARIVGAPKLYNRRLYVPVSSGEEGISANPAYPCCTFRGSIVALDADSGKQVWKSYTISALGKPTKKNSAGTQLWGPAGAAVWNSPTVDAKRKTLYVGTGDSYTEPAPKTSDAIMAFDMDKGDVLWSFQDTKDDAWMLGCENKIGNCPEKLGPDYDFSTSPILRTLPNGHQVLVVSGKSGAVLGLNPDKNGAVMWKTSFAEKIPDYTGLIVFGGAADEQAAYFALNQVGGMGAVWLANGERKWYKPLIPGDIPGEPPRPGQSAAVTSIPGVVFSGGWDGRLRALSTENGRVVWEYNTIHEYTTVNGVAAKGGSMGAPGPTVAGGMLFVGSGYVGISNGIPGNVLLAFSPE